MIKSARIASIDVFRALTMLCMIFVNDFWSLLNVPHWLEHAAYDEDFLGFSDVVFPSFLFVLGMSIPFAIENRLKKGDPKLKVVWHITLRTIALLVMGLFTVNTESGVSQAAGMGQPVFVILMVAAFFLIWNVYPKVNGWKKYLFPALQVVGVGLLVYLAVIFRDNDGEGMQKRWWGILGLIGWTYFLCALIYLLVRNRLHIQLLVWLAFVLLSIAGASHWLGFFDGIIISNGSLHVFTMSGLIVSLVFTEYRDRIPVRKLFSILIGSGIVLLLAGLFVRRFWIISKIAATPAWVFLCTGISILLYVFLYWLVELKGKERWFRFIGPAGTATLTCYLIPYILYSLFALLDITFPDIIRECPAGLIKSFLFAMAVIGIAALMGRIHIRLKI